MTRLFSEGWQDYELIDAGGSKKLERWGKIITIRPERNAYFKSEIGFGKWQKMAHFEFVEDTHTKGEWRSLKDSATEWQITFKDLVFNLKLTNFKHTGLFPEQRTNWDFISDHLSVDQKFLNLFAYTGAASLAAKKAGADVIHCDSIKQVINWTKENMELSNLDGIRWVLDDALKFAQKEAKRGRQYDGIIMDPPAFGIGAKKERWKIEDRFPELVKTASELLSHDGFLIINTYSPRLTEKEIQPTIKRFFPTKNVEINKLSIQSTSGKVIEYGELTRVW
jgi:23S rRNA (cytosine1962-C5)-methyltransferase